MTKTATKRRPKVAENAVPANDNTRPVLDKAEHVALLKQAIAANLDAREEHAKRQAAARAHEPPDFKLINCADLMRTPWEKLNLDGIIEDPTRRALKDQLKQLGRRLFDVVGSLDAMRDVAEEVASMKPRNWGTRIDIIDKNWDGIGDDARGRWWA
ncbi:MAG TPA: hypothetical protein VH684_25535 [Xanthobacteraceae bacterium]